MRTKSIVLLTSLLMAGCAVTGPEKPYTGAQDVNQISDEHARLWKQARDVEESIRKSGQIYQDEALRQYLQGLMDKLFPEFSGAIRVQVLKSPILNAFALPNGNIYIHIGLLARLDNEAQLATVLAHEGTHFTQKHGFQQQQTVKSASAFAVGANLIGIPLVGDLIAVSSIYGYSRELEREADAGGYQRLVTTGYDTRESVRVFEYLRAEAEALDMDEPFFFSSHPQLQERIDSFNELIKASNAAGKGKRQIARDEFMKRTSTVRTACLETDLSMHRYKSVILVLEGEEAAHRYTPQERHYYLGEAYRLRGEEGDAERALTSYEKAIKAGSTFAPPHRALGIHYYKAKQMGLARKHIEKYLKLAPKAPDREFLEQYLNIAKRGG